MQQSAVEVSGGSDLHLMKDQFKIISWANLVYDRFVIVPLDHWRSLDGMRAKSSTMSICQWA
jgi:hypothetical protein